MSDCLIEEYKIDDTQLVFLKNEPSLDLAKIEFREHELKRLNQFSSEKRKREFKGVVCLKNYLFENEEIIYSENGAPRLLYHAEKHISISHSFIYIGMLVADFQIGLDIELISDKVKRVTSKFINAHEEQHFDLNSAEELTRIWTMKEVLYKAVSIVGLDYQNHIIISQVNNTYFGCVLLKNQWYVTEFTTFVKDNYIFSFNKNALVQESNTYL